MKIVLAEERGGQQMPEQTFQHPTVKIGRDTSDCQIVFDNQQFPMVSRKHAELRWQNGQWFLADLGSSYGTYLNGQKISQPQAVQTGNALQLGANGPVLRVVRLEAAQPQSPVYAPQAEPQKPVSAPPLPQIPNQQQQVPNRQAPNQPGTGGSGSPETPQLIFVGTSRLEPYKITKDSFWLGRDPNCDIVMEANAVMVSRKHAQINRQRAANLDADADLSRRRDSARNGRTRSAF
jgi:pSer/pThr/pTyr-binding forkhead associated (FHA) protein